MASYRRGVLSLLERLGPERLDALRRAWWSRRMFIHVTPGDELARRALQGFPDEVRALGERCRIIRTNARYGGGFFPDRNEVELAAGVETYEGLAQVELSACHELFHYICWNDPRYRADEEQDFAYLRHAVRESRTHLADHPRYRAWVTGSFLRQGDHANPVEYFADIPTNFRDANELPPPIRGHFAPLIDGSPIPYDMRRPAPWSFTAEELRLASFQRWLAGEG